MQEEAGAQVLKLFESWAEGLPEDLFHRLVIRPHQIIVKRLRELGVTAPVIGFPRGAAAYAETYVEQVDVAAIALDTAAPAALGQSLQKRTAIQGALDPLLLRAGGPALERRVDQLLEQWGGGRYIFNLGHGILPDTPIAHVESVLRQVTGK
jgi:uroporphyrinogen decarboxylase